MFDVGFSELVMIAVVALLVLGPERLPGAAPTVRDEELKRVLKSMPQPRDVLRSVTEPRNPKPATSARPSRLATMAPSADNDEGSQGGDGHKANLRINLDIYEMLMPLNKGYRPSIEEQEGFYLSLAVFKNLLASVPYKEVLLTKAGHKFYEISREDNGVLSMNVSEKGAAYHVN